MSDVHPEAEPALQAAVAPDLHSGRYGAQCLGPLTLGAFYAKSQEALCAEEALIRRYRQSGEFADEGPFQASVGHELGQAKATFFEG